MVKQPLVTLRNKHLNLKNLDLSSIEFPLEQIDLSKYEGIQKGIPLFENNSLQDIKFISKWFQVLNLARGCTQRCSFCIRCSQYPIKEVDNKISTILWDDLIRFTEGFSILGERLGFNPISKNSHLVLFEDANLPDARIKDIHGEIHNVRECIEQIWNKLRMPFILVTSGWYSNDKFSQQTSEEICNFMVKNPTSIKEFGISVNPFYKGDKDFYTSKVANAIKTFLPIFKNGNEQGTILIKYNRPDGIKADTTGIEETTKLYNEIYSKLQKMTDCSLEYFDVIKPENVTRHNDNKYILNRGNARNYFQSEDVEEYNKKIQVESQQWQKMTKQEKYTYSYENTTKNVNINGNIYLVTPSEQVINTTLKLNYINKDKITAPIHSDVEFEVL